MKVSSTIALCLVGGASGWTLCSPKRMIKKSIQKGFVVAGGVVAGTALVAGTATIGTVGAAAVAYNQLSNREVYEPAPGSMGEY